jgi:hypothetical protein
MIDGYGPTNAPEERGLRRAAIFSGAFLSTLGSLFESIVASGISM